MITTRGLPPAGSRDPRDCENRFYALAIPSVWMVKPERQKVGIDLTISSVQRIPPESLDPPRPAFPPEYPNPAPMPNCQSQDKFGPDETRRSKPFHL